MRVRPCAAGLSEAPAAAAVRARLAWKSALALALPDPGFEASGLSACRQRLRTGPAARLLCETMVTRLRAQGLLNAQGRQRTASPHGLAALHTLNRLAWVGATLRPGAQRAGHRRAALAALLGPSAVV
jgi:hypothetical protein